MSVVVIALLGTKVNLKLYAGVQVSVTWELRPKVSVSTTASRRLAATSFTEVSIGRERAQKHDQFGANRNFHSFNYVNPPGRARCYLDQRALKHASNFRRLSLSTGLFKPCHLPSKP